MLRPVPAAIIGVYLVRAAALPVLFKVMPDRSPAFLVRSSLTVLAIGAVHLVGMVTGLVR